MQPIILAAFCDEISESLRHRSEMLCWMPPPAKTARLAPGRCEGQSNLRVQ